MYGVRMMGNIHTYAKQRQMEMQWQLKQDSGTSSAVPFVATDSEAEKGLVDSLTVEAPSDEEIEATRKKKEEILQKLKMGNKLTDEDLEFLKKNDPILYEEYVTAEEARKYEEKAYKEALKKCKTKEDVERLKSTTAGKHLARVKSIENNPHIPEEKKALHIGVERRKAEDARRHTDEFVRKGEYDKLPSEAEVREAERAEAEEQREEMGLSPDGIRIEETPEDVKAPEKVDQTEPADENTSKIEREDKPEKPEREKPEIDIETEAERKVRRAKAKAAYAWAQNDKSSDDADTGSGWSVKA